MLVNVSSTEVYSLLLQTASANTAVPLIERTGHIAARSPVNISPILRVHLVQHQTETLHQRIPLPGTVGLQIQRSLLRQERKAEGFADGRVLDPSQRRGLLPDVDVHDVRQGHLMQFAQFQFLGAGRDALFAHFGPPRDGGFGEDETYRFGFAAGAVRDYEDAGVA